MVVRRPCSSNASASLYERLQRVFLTLISLHHLKINFYDLNYILSLTSLGNCTKLRP